jgi:AbrB family looped-hinge helix DNA binding protein
MITGTMTSKGQTTIPKEIREFLKLKPGDQLRYNIVDGNVVLRAKNGSVKELGSILPRPKRSASLEEIEKGIVAGALKSAGY